MKLFIKIAYSLKKFNHEFFFDKNEYGIQPKMKIYSKKLLHTVLIFDKNRTYKTMYNTNLVDMINTDNDSFIDKVLLSIKTIVDKTINK